MCLWRITKEAEMHLPTEITLFENYSKCRIWILAFSINFCPIKTDLSGNTVWRQASGFQKLAKMDDFWHFQWTFVYAKCKRSSLGSQYWMRLFLWFSNTVRNLIPFWIFAREGLFQDWISNHSFMYAAFQNCKAMSHAWHSQNQS